jgi:hypothetical protein
MKFWMLAVFSLAPLLAQSPPEPKADWERTKACAAQAEKTAQRRKVRLVENHYSPKYERCFLLAEAEVSGGKVSIGMLIDAFEGADLASIVTHLDPQENKTGEVLQTCELRSGGRPCKEVRAYIDDRMNN